MPQGAACGREGMPCRLSAAAGLSWSDPVWCIGACGRNLLPGWTSWGNQVPIIMYVMRCRFPEPVTDSVLRLLTQPPCRPYYFKQSTTLTLSASWTAQIPISVLKPRSVASHHQ